MRSFGNTPGRAVWRSGCMVAESHAMILFLHWFGLDRKAVQSRDEAGPLVVAPTGIAVAKLWVDTSRSVEIVMRLSGLFGRTRRTGRAAGPL